MLEISAQEFEYEIADECGEQADGEVLRGKDIAQREGQGFTSAVGGVKFAHQEIGVEEEEDEGDLYHRPEKSGERAGGSRLSVHVAMVQNRGEIPGFAGMRR
jgi:hypothetical protein